MTARINGRSHTWQGSTAQAWCKDFAGEPGAASSITDAFTAGEPGTVSAIEKSSNEYACRKYFKREQGIFPVGTGSGNGSIWLCG